jgi:hypothetical protein
VLLVCAIEKEIQQLRLTDCEMVELIQDNHHRALSALKKESESTRWVKNPQRGRKQRKTYFDFVKDLLEETIERGREGGGGGGVGVGE